MKNTMSKEARREMANEANRLSKQRAAGVLQLRPSGIWAVRPIKKAKESAKWIDDLMRIRELDGRIHIKHVDMVSSKDAQEKSEFQIWWTQIHNYDFERFNADEKAYETMRRKLENRNAREQIANRADVAADVFTGGLMSAANILHIDIDELVALGCKKLFEGIKIRTDAIDDFLAKRDDTRKYFEFLVNRNGEVKKTAIEFERPRIKAINAALNELRAERKVLSAALKEYRENTDDATRALIDARAKVNAKRARKQKELVGRQIDIVAKPEVKGFKMLSIDSCVFLPKNIIELRNKLNVAARAVLDGNKKRAKKKISDDDLRALRHDAYMAFVALYNAVKKMLDDGTPLEANAEYAKVVNGRQAQVWDVIGVPYGRETDMVVSLDHSMAHLLPDYIGQTLSDDPKKAQANIDGLETMMLNVLTKNGLNIKFKHEDGTRTVHYNFWNANNSALKVGKCYVMSDGAFEIAKHAVQMGMADEEYFKMRTNGSDMLKYWSYASTPGAPLTYNKQELTIDDVLVVDSIDLQRTFSNILEFDSEWNRTNKKFAKVSRTAYDGQMFFMVPIPSQQLRGGMAFKGYGVRCAKYDKNGNIVTIIDEIARREGREIPEYIRDMDGNMRKWREYKIIATRDCFKWASFVSYEEYCNKMRKVAEKIPCANMMYTARIADATEESRRRLTRQSTQQFMFATNEEIEQLFKKSVDKVNKLNTHDGVIRKLAGLDKDEKHRNALEHLIEVAPEILDHPLTRRYVEDVFHRTVAEAAVRPDVDGIYPYIAEDPVAFFKIVLWGEDPNKLGLGYLDKDQVNIPAAEEGKEMYLVRYPNNYLCGMVAANHNDPIYDCVGNTMILSLDGYWLTRADGDVDGDEMCAIFNPEVVRNMKKTIYKINPPLIVFPHDKLGKKVLVTFEERAFEIAKAMVTANKFGPAVGQNSNLATRFMHMAGLARMEIARAYQARDQKALNKATLDLKEWLDKAIIAHIAAIIAIDLAKTGKMPEWLENELANIEDSVEKLMPWNQRFCKDCKTNPWYAPSWNEKTRAKEDDFVDRGAAYVVNATGAYYYKAPTGTEFEVASILCDKTGLYLQGSSGRLATDELRSLDARNYRSENKEGTDDYKIIRKLHSNKETDKVGFTDLFLFLWRNQANLIFKLQKNDRDENKIDNADMVNEYYQTVRNIMLRFGSYCGNETFSKLSPEDQAKSNVWKAMKFAFDLNNKVGGEVMDIPDDLSEEEQEIYEAERDRQLDMKRNAQASFCMFVLKVFGYDLYNMVCDKKGIADRWVMPQKRTMDDEDASVLNDGSFDMSDFDNIPDYVEEMMGA